MVFLAVLIPLFYFAVLAPSLAAQQPPDLILISFLYGLWMAVARSANRRHPLTNHRPDPIPRKQYFLLFSVTAIALVFRLMNPSSSSLFIDEILSLEIASIGNTGIFSSDSRMWGIIAASSYELGGVSLLRAVAALLGTFLVSSVFCLAYILTRRSKGRNGQNYAPALSALLFSLCAPSLYISTIATHDALSLCFFVWGAIFLYLGTERAKRTFLVLAAYLFFCSFISRYFIVILFILIPSFAKLASPERTPKDALFQRWWFWSPLIAFHLIYGLFEWSQIGFSIMGAVHFSRLHESAESQSLISLFLLHTLPVLLLGILLFGLRLLIPKRGSSETNEHSLRTFLWMGTALLPLFYLFKQSDYELEKNLCYSLLFGSILVGLTAQRLLEDIRPVAVFGKLLMGVFAALFLFAQWWSTAGLLPTAFSDYRLSQMEKVYSGLLGQPFPAMFTAASDVQANYWFDPEPVLTRLLAEGLEKQELAVQYPYGGSFINLFLMHRLGRVPGEEQYYAHYKSPDKDAFAYAARNRLPVVLAIIPELEPSPFERHKHSPRFFQLGSIHLGETIDPYTRVFLFVNPDSLDVRTLPSDKVDFYSRFREATGDSYQALTEMRLGEQEAVIGRTEQTLEEIDDLEKRFVLVRALGTLALAQGERTRGLEMLSQAKGLAKGKPALLRSLDEYSFSVAQSSPTSQMFQQLPGRDLLEDRKIGTLNANQVAELRSQSSWIQFDSPIALEKHSIVRAEVTLTGTDVLAIRLLEVDQDPNQKGQLLKLPSFEGRQTIFIRVGTAARINRIDFHYGESAWGPLGGRNTADLEIHNLSILP